MDNLAIQCVQIRDSDFSNDLLVSRSKFEQYLIRIILTKGLSTSPRIDTVIFFPDTLTIVQRHRVHTFGQKNKVKTRTKVKDGIRSIAVHLSPHYVIDLINGHFYGN